MPPDTLFHATVVLRAWWHRTTDRVADHLGDDRGEGVISAAMAVLIMAGIAALMWVGFRAIWEDTEDNTRTKVAEIGG